MTNQNPSNILSVRVPWTTVAASALDSLCIEGLASAELLLSEPTRSFCRQLLVRTRHEWQQSALAEPNSHLRGATAVLANLEDSVNTAIAAVYANTTLPSGQRELWVTLTYATLTREMMRAALECLDPVERDATVVFAEHLARTVRSRMGDVVASSSRDAVANASRRAFAELHESAIAQEKVPTFTTALFGHLRHGASQIRSGNAMDTIARSAVSRADRAEHGDTHSAWTRADFALRRALVVASLCEASVTLARASARESNRNIESAVGLARGASGLLGAAGESASWLYQTETPREDSHETSSILAAISKVQSTASGAPVAASTIQPSSQPTPRDSAMTNAKDSSTSPSSPVSAVRATTGKVIETLENDAQDAAWRLAGSQFVKLMRDPLVGLMSRHLAPNDESMRARIAGFLETEVGTALLSAVLSAALSSLPRAAGPVPDRLARELRVRAMADAGDVVADLVMGPMRQVVALYLQDPGFQTSATSAAAPSLEGPRVAPVATGAEERVALS